MCLLFYVDISYILISTTVNDSFWFVSCLHSSSPYLYFYFLILKCIAQVFFSSDFFLTQSHARDFWLKFYFLCMSLK